MTDTYVAIDLETTGLNPKRDKIIEIGAVRIERGEEKADFQSFVNPGRTLDDRIKNLTGIHDEMLADAPSIDEILPSLFAFLENDVILGHMIIFDFSFIKQAAVNCGMSFEKAGIDTLKLSRKFLPERNSRKLEDLCIYYGMVHTAHRALDDAKAAADLYGKLAELYYNEEDFRPIPLSYHAKKETPATKPQKERLYKLADKHRIMIEYDIERLSRSEASRLTDQILAEYGR